MRHLQSLTPLRGIAALTVLMFHLARNGGDSSLPAFFLRGYLGVDLFFVLSGFVLTHVYVQGFLGDTSWRSAGAFLWARVARIYPVHFFVTALLVACGGAQGLSGLDVLDNFLLILVPWPVHSINQPSWSLSAEWHAYLLFPLMVGWLWRCNGRIAAAICFALLLGLDIAIIGSFGDLREIGGGWGALARALPEFALGVITYRAFSDPHAARIWRSDVAFLAVAGALALAFEFMPNDGIIVALLPLLLLAAVRNTGLAARVLNAAPLRWMGDISYSVYLGQAFAFSAVLTLATTPLGPALGLDGLRALAVVFALAIGALIYRCVEVPCRALLHRAALPLLAVDPSSRRRCAGAAAFRPGRRPRAAPWYLAARRAAQAISAALPAGRHGNRRGGRARGDRPVARSGASSSAQRRHILRTLSARGRAEAARMAQGQAADLGASRFRRDREPAAAARPRWRDRRYPPRLHRALPAGRVDRLKRLRHPRRRRG